MSGTELHDWLALDVERARRVITGFLAQYQDRAGTQGVVLGLSGGLDSATTAALATQALGPEAVDIVFLPGPTTSEEDRAVATEVADALGLDLPEAPIGPAAQALVPELGIEADRDVRANLQARLRMVVLYARAQATGRLVAGTGNKSELLTGYFTKHGDGGCDILPLGDLYKTQVRALARALELPGAVIDRAPTAGLWEGQTDEADLGITYDDLDVVLAGIEAQRSDQAIAKASGQPTEEVERIRRLVRTTWHKRNPAPVPKLGWRTVGVDWRESTM